MKTRMVISYVFFPFQSHIRIWHGVSLSTYSVIGVGVFSGGILSIGFPTDVSTHFILLLTLKAPNKNYSRRHFNFLLLSFEENKA